jgi:hypothetical protein
MGRGVKNKEVFPAASRDGFTAARNVSSGSPSHTVSFARDYWMDGPR